MAIFIPPRGSDASLSSIALIEGELVYNTTQKKFYTGDGVTSGGIPVFQEQGTDMSQYATKADLAGLLSGELDPVFTTALSSLATKEYAEAKAREVVNTNDNDFVKSDFAQSLINSAVSGLATKAELEDYAKAEDIPEVSEFVKTVDADIKYAAKEDVERDYAAKKDMLSLESSLSSYAELTALDDYLTIANAANYAKGEDLRDLLMRVVKMSKDVDAIKHKVDVPERTYNPVIVNVSNDNVLSLADTTADAIVSNQTIVAPSSTTLTAKSIDMNNCTITTPAASGAIGFVIDAKEDLAMTNSTVNAALSGSSNVFEVHSAEVIKYDGVTFTGNSYNTIMTGQRANVDPKYVDILNCNFNEKASHVNIWIGGWQDEAVVNIRNCKFSPGAEQNILFGDGGADTTKSNSLTVNISDCEMTSTETNPSWHGFLGMQTLTTNGSKYPASTDAAQQINPFKNVTINISNVTVNGVKLTKDNFKMGEQGDNQQLWIYLPAWNSNVQFAAYPEFFPTVYVDGELITQLA